jgi:hypothetical protein
MDSRILWPAIALVALGALLTACNSSGIAAKPRAKFAQLSCLDLNGDLRVNGADGADASLLPDFNADGSRDDNDAAFVRGVDIPLNEAAKGTACDEGVRRQPEYLVAHDFFERADVSCTPGRKAVLVMGIAGGVSNLRDRDDAAGVRSIVDALIRKYESNDIATIGVVAGSAFYGADNAHQAMEDWLTNAARVHLDRFPCLQLVTVGFSHGGVTAAVVAARLEHEYGQRTIATVLVDRVEDLYNGDVTSMPRESAVVNVYQHNDALAGSPIDAPNVLNFDASVEYAPRDGHKGGPMEVVRHVTLDNSKAVREAIVNIVFSRS